MTKVMLTNGLLGLRAGFAAFYKPEAFGDGEPAFQGTLIIPPKAKVVKLIDETYLALATADKKWGNGDAAKAQKMIDNCMKDRKKSAWQKSEYTNDAGDPYDGFEDAFYLRARNEIQPLLINQLKQEVGRGAPGAPYGGCFVNMQVDLWLQNHTEFGKGLRCKMLGVQFVREGDAFTGGAKANVDDFETLAVETDDEDDDSDLG